MAISRSEQIKKDVVDQLYWDQSVDASDVIVEVSGSNVRLRGTVPSYTARLAAYNDAAMIPGVVNVDNELEVALPPSMPPATDEEIKQRAESMLYWDADIDALDITVSVHAGYVTLSGSVDAYWKKIMAEDLVSGISGVKDVNNALSVVLSERIADKLIADDLTSALKRRAGLDVNLIDITVENGVVTLLGTVPSWATYLGVQETARYTAGVVDVINQLRVQA